MNRMMKCLCALIVLFGQLNFAMEKPPSPGSQTQANLLPLEERKRLFREAGAKPAAVPVARQFWGDSSAVPVSPLNPPPGPLQPVTVPARPLSSVERKFWGDSAAQPNPVKERKFEFSNQSDQLVTVWLPHSHPSNNCWLPRVIRPYKDSGNEHAVEGAPIYIFTKAPGRFIMQTGPQGSYRLLHESVVNGEDDVVAIREMPYEEVQDIVVVIDPDGSVDFAKRRP